MINYRELLTPWSNLALGESVAGQLCPFCNGGDEKEKSFSVTNRGGVLLFICHRNKCHRAGACHPGRPPLFQVFTKTKEHKEFTDATVPLDHGQIEFFKHVYGFTEEELKQAGLMWVPAREAVWHPVYGPDGYFRGQVVRRYADKRIWTYKSEINGRFPMVAWFKGPEGCNPDAVCVVEDILSAIKFSRFHKSCALLGTSINNDIVLDLMRNSKVQYLALDRDATEKAAKYAARWKVLLDIIVVPCKKDPKYWQDEQLKAIKE